MAQEIAQGDIFGRIGKQIGEGIAEQVPRNQLSSQLSQIQGLPPQLAKAALLPGGLEAIKPYLGYLQTQAFANQGTPQNGGIVQEGQTPQTGQASQQQAPKSKLLSQNPQARIDLAKQLIREQPAIYGSDQNAAFAEADRQIGVQKEQLADVQTQFRDLINTSLTNEGITPTQQLTGQLENMFLREAQSNVIDKDMPVAEAVRNAEGKALDFAKARNILVTEGPGFWSGLLGEGKNRLKALKAAYDTTGNPELFVNDLIQSKNFSLPFASAFANPPKGEFKTTLAEVPKQGFNSRMDAVLGNGKIDKNVFNKVLSSMKSGDSVQAASYELKKKGYSPKAFLDYASDNASRLSPYQTRDLARQTFIPGTLTDFLYESLTE